MQFLLNPKDLISLVITLPLVIQMSYRTIQVPYGIVLYHSVPYDIVQYCTVPYYNVPCGTVPYGAVPYCLKRQRCGIR